MHFIVYRIFWLVSLLPLGVLYFFSDALYLLIYYVVGYRRKIVRKNLTNSFPEKSQNEIISIERKFYHFFCDLIFETIKEITISDKEFSKRVIYVNPERVDNLLRERQSIIIMTAHYGNWEWASYFSAYLNQFGFFSFQIYKKLNNKKVDKIVYDIRSRFGAVNIEKNELLRKIIRNKTEGKVGLYGMVADQSPNMNNIAFRMEFLNQDTAVMNGSEQLAMKFGFPVYYLHINRPKRGQYVFDLVPICEDPINSEKNEITTTYFKMLEETIRSRPELWLWSHNRWKR